MSTRARALFRVAVRLVAIVPVLASLTIVGSASKLGPAVAGCAQAATMHHAGLVIEHGDGAVIKVCVAFSEDTITGAQLLDRSGVQYGPGYSGQAVCQVDHEPTQYDPNSCLSAGEPYWAMYVSRGGGSWVYSSTGFSSQAFHDGDAEGFRYEAEGAGTVPPSAAGVCPVNSAPTPGPAKTPVARRVSGPASPRPSLSASATATASSAARLAPTAASSSPSDSPTPHHLLGLTSGAPAPTAFSAGSGTWIAGALGVALVVALALQVTRVRRHSARRPPP